MCNAYLSAWLPDGSLDTILLHTSPCLSCPAPAPSKTNLLFAQRRGLALALMPVREGMRPGASWQQGSLSLSLPAVHGLRRRRVHELLSAMPFTRTASSLARVPPNFNALLFPFPMRCRARSWRESNSTQAPAELCQQQKLGCPATPWGWRRGRPRAGTPGRLCCRS